MSGPSFHLVTDLLFDWTGGDRAAFDELVPLACRIAAHSLRHERANHTRQSTVLANEADVRLIQQRPVRWQNRAHFRRVAALDSVDAIAKERDIDVIPRHLLESHFFGGLSINVAAVVLAGSPGMISPGWSSAKACLHREIRRGDRS